ncbi:protein-export chaperone SecB [Candidatus Erwinia haradaeae]|uniref:Protein-export protein SecB n=1 Tax=Candidatus Erwinia haradaeae TaxID=1922217 RepID=A0A451DG51_9GAMM|nr:protein-export chaperone SecB [Candidatus Erwinia haradaeae]VFP85609.1 Protein-export protein SecB [Candidatus Erwinia haradaeae]
MLEKYNSDKSPQINRIYTKNISFESPQAPQVFQKPWDPQVTLNLGTSSTHLIDKMYEVILRVTVITSLAKNTIFLCEVEQAGVFSIKETEKNKLEHSLGSYCPNLLFPYARECIANLIWHSTFPPLHLEPVNFDTLFMKYLQKSKHTEHTPDT